MTRVGAALVSGYFSYRVGVGHPDPEVLHDPAIFVRALYHARVDGKVAAGDLKMAVVWRPQHPVFCSLDVPGYADTFIRLGSEFASSFEWKSPPSTPVRKEAWVLSINEQPVGFQAWTVTREERGALVSFAASSMMVPMSATELKTVDEVVVTKTTADGRVTDGRWMQGENGALTLEVELTGKGNRYQYAGNIQGKPVKGTARSERGVTGMVAVTRRLGKLTAKQKPKSFTLDEYHPGIDPAQVTAVAYAFSPESGGGSLEATVGETRLLMEVDEAGFVKRVVFPIGQHQLIAERMAEVGGL